MDGKYLEQSREEMLKAVDENPVREEDQHDLRAVAALTEAVAELSDRVIRLETGPTETVDELTPFDVMLPESEATERQTT